ncbi:hypothetical protein BD779DRAFT_1790718 [Infundibulicybe gibba]|nr:hypothetical protein BD779DRAFT_1790718 [Infundibulicybe gibba]
MGPNPIVILSIVAFITAAAADVTLYSVLGPGLTLEPSPIASGTYTLSAVGVDSGGSTTYVGSGVESLVALPDGTTTQTLLSTPSPFTNTIVEGKSGYREGDTSCTFVPGGEGSCLQVVSLLAATGTTLSAITFTLTGSVVPWTTIRDPGPTAAPNGAGGLHFPSILAIVCLSVVYLLL